MGLFSRRDKDGYDKKGFDKDGYNRSGFNDVGIHKVTGTKFDESGYDLEGFDKDGFSRGGFNLIGFDRFGFHRSGIHSETGTKLDESGYDEFGFNMLDDKDILNRITGTKFSKYGYDKKGFNKSLLHRITGTKFDESGYDVKGLNKVGLQKHENILDDDLTKNPKNIVDIFSEYHSPYDVLIKITYASPVKIKSQLFFRMDDNPEIYSKEFKIEKHQNLIHLHIEKASKGHSTTWNYDGDGVIGDNFEAGYTLFISLQYASKKLRKLLIDKLNGLNFGCLTSDYTIHCHKDDKYPDDNTAEELLQKVVEIFNPENDVKSI